MPYDAKDIAKFFFKLDRQEKLFSNDKMVTINNLTMYEGNIRVNKFLHLSQNVYVAKYGKKLFFNDLYAFDNGAVVREVQTNYQALKHEDFSDNEDFGIDEETSLFLKKMFYVLQNASVEELIKISHEDEEWIECHQLPHGRQLMNPLHYMQDYQNQYADVISLLDRDYINQEASSL